MSANSILQLPPCPSSVAISRSKKAEMKKDILLMLERKKLGWSPCAVSSSGESFINLTTDCLWYLDGYYQAFKDRCLEIPSEFNLFQGYNKPEASRHRRREVGTLDASTLDAFSSSLSKLLLQPWFDLKGWKAMRSNVSSLAECMAKYATYLKSKCDSIKTHHAALEPVRSASVCESFCFISKAVWIEPATALKYRNLQEGLDATKEFEPLLLNDYAPISTR